MKAISKDGRVSGYGDGGQSFVASYDAVRDAFNQAETAWVLKMIAAGVKGAHPDDGWVDRKNNSIRPCYPQFWHLPEAGDVIALGSAEKHRLVRTTRVESAGLLAMGLSEGIKRQVWFFDPITSPAA